MRQARIKPSEVDTFMHLFMKNVMVRTRGEAAVAKRRLTRALAPEPAAPHAAEQRR